MGYTPPFHISESMLLKATEITEKATEIKYLYPIDKHPHLRRISQIQSIHSSLKIEANSLSLQQVKDVIDGHIIVGDAKEILEVQNAYEAYEQLEAIDPYELDELLRIHGIMTKGLEKEAGKFRTGEEGVFNGDQCIFMAPPARLVSMHMHDLFAWMNEVKDSLHPLLLSSIFHYEFVFIHPFTDGSGRMARLWQTALLCQWKPLFKYFPLESQIESFQQEYYDAISTCHKMGNSDVFIEFMLDQIDALLDDAKQKERDASQENRFVSKLLGVMEYEVSYSAKALMDKLDLKSKENFRLHYLKPALELGLIEMTNPDKPTSRNQRYVKRIF